MLLKNNNIISVFFAGIYFLLSFYGILNHEIWLDEAHSFLIARDSASLGELFSNTRQEGHPLLWYLLLWPLTKITHDVFYMQLLHILIATLNIFLLFHFSPFKWFEKILFPFSYYFFYEYNIISRNYVLCLLFVTIFCILICRGKRNYILIALSLLFLANSHFLGFLLSLPMAIVSGILLSGDKIINSKKNLLGSGFILIIGYFIGYFICIMQVLPDTEPAFYDSIRSEVFSVKRLSSFTVLFKALYQFPDIFKDNFWNTNIFTSNKTFGLISSILVTAAVLKIFIRYPLSFILILFSTAFISTFFFTELMINYTVRHWGFIFLGFYAALWIEKGLNQKKYLHYLEKKIRYPVLFLDNQWLKKSIVYSALITQTAASTYLYASDLKAPFSNSLSVANYLKENNYDQELIIVSHFTTGPAIAAYLDQMIYYPEYHGTGSFGLWNTWPVFVDKNDLLKELTTLKSRGHSQAVLILDTESWNINGKLGNFELKFLTRFDRAITKNENYNLYLARLK